MLKEIKFIDYTESGWIVEVVDSSFFPNQSANIKVETTIAGNVVREIILLYESKNIDPVDNLIIALMKLYGSTNIVDNIKQYMDKVAPEIQYSQKYHEKVKNRFEKLLMLS